MYTTQIYSTFFFDLEINSIIHSINRIKKKSYVIISIITELTLSKIQHCIMIKHSEKKKRNKCL